MTIPHRLFLPLLILLLLGLHSLQALPQDTSKLQKDLNGLMNEVSGDTLLDYFQPRIQGDRLILEGFTTDPRLRDAVLLRLGTLDGISEIDDQVEIVSLSAREREVAEHFSRRLQRAFGRSFSTDEADIRIRVRKGEITLVGFVSTPLQREVAEAQALATPRVRSVINELSIRPRR